MAEAVFGAPLVSWHQPPCPSSPSQHFQPPSDVLYLPTVTPYRPACLRNAVKFSWQTVISATGKAVWRRSITLRLHLRAQSFTRRVEAEGGTTNSLDLYLRTAHSAPRWWVSAQLPTSPLCAFPLLHFSSLHVSPPVVILHIYCWFIVISLCGMEALWEQELCFARCHKVASATHHVSPEWGSFHFNPVFSKRTNFNLIFWTKDQTTRHVSPEWRSFYFNPVFSKRINSSGFTAIIA